MRHLAILSGLVASFLIALSAAASPGDPRVVQGVLVWSAGGDGAPFVVVRGDDGRHYVADVSAAQRRGERPLNVGDRVSVVGAEGARPWEMSALVLGLGNSALNALPPPVASPPAPSGMATPAPRPSPERPVTAAQPWRRIHGRIESIEGKTLRLRDDADGRSVTVDTSQLKGNAETALRAGDDVTVFVVAENDQRLVAVGFIHTNAPQPAASPRQPR